MKRNCFPPFKLPKLRRVICFDPINIAEKNLNNLETNIQVYQLLISQEIYYLINHSCTDKSKTLITIHQTFLKCYSYYLHAFGNLIYISTSDFASLFSGFPLLLVLWDYNNRNNFKPYSTTVLSACGLLSLSMGKSKSNIILKLNQLIITP
jgi:hypothetical protein